VIGTGARSQIEHDRDRPVTERCDRLLDDPSGAVEVDHHIDARASACSMWDPQLDGPVGGPDEAATDALEGARREPFVGARRLDHR